MTLPIPATPSRPQHWSVGLLSCGPSGTVSGQEWALAGDKVVASRFRIEAVGQGGSHSQVSQLASRNHFGRLPIGNRRYSRLEVCATAEALTLILSQARLAQTPPHGLVLRFTGLTFPYGSPYGLKAQNHSVKPRSLGVYGSKPPGDHLDIPRALPSSGLAPGPWSPFLPFAPASSAS